MLGTIGNFLPMLAKIYSENVSYKKFSIKHSNCKLKPTAKMFRAKHNNCSSIHKLLDFFKNFLG